jgi:hypothetical protein
MVLAFASLAFSGCATITSNEMQLVSLNAAGADGKPIDKAKCTLNNDRGSWDIVAPGFVSVRRSAEDLTVQCKKEGIADGFLRAISRAASGMFGNILFGGGIGALIDHNKGTGYEYPDELQVRMGASSTVDKKDALPPATARVDDPTAPAKN